LLRPLTVKVNHINEYMAAERHPDFSWYFGESSPSGSWIFEASAADGYLCKSR
jgi:hypothetical protein